MRTRTPVNTAPLTSTTAVGFLLKSHYLADEFPSVVTTTNFADYCVANHASLPSVDTLLKHTTLCGTFSMPRSASTRRVLALPQPVSVRVGHLDHALGQFWRTSAITASGCQTILAEPDRNYRGWPNEA
jgi:hypothetical protein